MSTQPLNADEQWLVDSCRMGRKADFSQREGSSAIQPELSADLIRRLVLGQIDVNGTPVSLPLGLQVRGAKIRGRLQLADAGGFHGNGSCAPLVFECCYFETEDPCPKPDQRTEPTVDLRHIRCSRVAFVDCQMAMLALDDALIAGDLDLSGLRSSGGDGMQCWVRARCAHVEGSVTLSRACLRLEQAAEGSANELARSKFACDLQGAVVEGNLIGSDGLTIFGGMALPRQVKGDVDLRGAALTCDRSPKARGLALTAQSSEVDGVLVLRPLQREHDILPFKCDGVVDLYGLKVGGSLDLSGGQFFGPAGDDATPAILAYVLEVCGSVFMNEWTPQLGLPSYGAPWPTTVNGSSLDFRSATIGKSMFVALHVGESAAQLICDGLCVAGELHVKQASVRCSLKAMRIGGDLNISSSAVDGAAPPVDVSDSTVGGNLWLHGRFEEFRAWNCNVQGQFGGREYEAARIVAPESQIRGQSYFRAKHRVDVRAAKLVAMATISSTGKVPGIDIYASNLCADQDVVVEGKIQSLEMTMAVIGGHLRAKECSVNEAKFEGVRVRGSVELPRHIFGPLSLASACVEGAILLRDIRLHLRRRPTGQTEPSIDFSDMRIEGDLKVAELVRTPATGVLEEVREVPPWLATVDKKLKVPGEAFMLRRVPCFYDEAEVVELHLPIAGDPDGSASSIEIECHSFLLLADGRTIYLNGQSQPIHGVNEAKGDKRPLHLDNDVKVFDYLRFFCGYVWGDEGAFVIVDSLEPSDWLQFIERDEERLSGAPIPPQVRREGDHWVCHALVLYADHLYITTFQIAVTGMIEMSDDVPVARLAPQGVDYAKPCRRYQLAQKAETGSGPLSDERPVHRTLHEVIRDNGWMPVTDTAARVAVIDRIRVELTEMKKRHVTVEDEVRVVIDLRGCRCNSLEDDDGNGWGDGLTVDLRGFEYQNLAEGSSGRRREANEAFAAPGVALSDTVGASLGRQRSTWLERVTRGIDFSVTPYEQLVRALARRGDPDAARTVLERRLQCENERQTWWTRWWIWVGVQLPFRYGLFSKRGIVVSLLYWLLGIVAFDVANYGALRLPPIGAGGSRLVVGQLELPISPVLVVDSQAVTMSVVSTQAGDKLVTAKVPQSDNLTEEVSCGDQVEPSLYALDVMLPLLDLHQESKCAISSADGLEPFLWRLFRALYAIVGAYMTSMLILTLSGVLRRSTER